MSKVSSVWLMALVSGAGLGLTFVYAPLGIGVSFVATAVAFFSMFRLNVPAVRLAIVAAAALNAASIYVATRSWPLAATAVVLAVCYPVHELTMRHARTLQDVQPAVGLLVGVTLLWLAWPTGWWGLAVVPNFLLGGMCAFFALGGRATGTKNMARVGLKVGATMPDVELPFREGEGHFSLAEHRGSFVLLCFVRGDWCPVCHVLMRIISRQTDTLKKYGVHVVLITPSEGPLDVEMVERFGLRAGMLLDKDASLARAIGIIEQQKDGKDVPLPVAVLVDPQGIVRSISRPDDVAAYSSDRGIAEIVARFQPVAA